ncbi:Phosphomannomutase [Babesia sp. Xinjiang]|uniref:Phosphomannomutase n=1 Tax=Babesia sp. Xinjiang TaxID=462227 RepID=UPI000A249B0B|nr:Phosphomannomutase [Babesia sp. Xinjiang]ORM39424.1 Phosphomannomutase [Babesia sp. Xinjiang]
MTRSILVFDLDGTLTQPVQPLTDDMKVALLRCKEKGHDIAIASGSKYMKIANQVGEEFLPNFKFIFAENGTQVYEDGVLVKSLDILDFVPEKTLKELVEFSLRYIADLDIPVKRGTFVEHRKSLINLCPVGRNCSAEDRIAFAALDNSKNIRQKFISELESKFGSGEVQLRFVAGGQISVDVFPKSWDKSITLINLGEYDVIHYFGDNTKPGGNDYEIYSHPDVMGHTVKDYRDLIVQLNELLA